MTNYIDLALEYGGFTSLDANYLKTCLQGLDHSQKLKVITPPPSVINAYFAEIYQKQSPKAATDYFFNLSQALELTVKEPDFKKEEKPFIRLNIAGKSYGFAYEGKKELALVFSEKEEGFTELFLFELVKIFPHYLAWLEDGKLKMQAHLLDSSNAEEVVLEGSLLTKAFQLDNGWTVISGYNAEEVLELGQSFSGEKYYGFEQREFKLYINN
ncbi:cystathionine beta-lyase [Streptococcus didelphis]|uniref:hypothetical protein n=1 Tax=Streptococcus didelphis TaxID=102886 RepID=UPI00036DD18D|nr:hypothetical protein [Streptococcus didelphis]